MSNLREFLESNSAAQKIQLESFVVLNRMNLSARDILSLGDAGTYTLEKAQDDEVELQIGESVIAVGKIVEESGEYYFEVSEVFQGSDEKEGQG